MKNGFSILEVIIALAILAILAGIGFTAVVSSRTAKQLDIITDSIAAKLEEARTNAVSGKNGTNFGLALNTTAYTYWSGSSYNQSDSSNSVYSVTPGFSITSTIPGTYHAVMFARITGVPDVTGNIIITNNQDTSTTDTIIIGVLGDITVIK
ncbi:MAG: prepilin-type N-terminal cleavage/methylation domain-containing protein [Patescibacteria group bacterium]